MFGGAWKVENLALWIGTAREFVVDVDASSCRVASFSERTRDSLWRPKTTFAQSGGRGDATPAPFGQTEHPVM